MPDPIVSYSDSELQPRVEEALASQYELVREIGRGGMGVVYLARDRRLKRPVAIKLLPPELAFRAEIRTRFLKEAETAAQLSHPNIVPIFSVDERSGLVYFVMGFVDGKNLAQLLHERGRMDPDETRRILRDVADALAYAHARGVIHRDIKPDNILIFEEDGRVMVTDFGIARAITEGSDARLTATGMAIGTPAYMSPEQSAGERAIDGRSDLYSLGVVGYQMLTGEPPFVANSTPALLVKHISETPRPVQERVPEVPADLASIVMRLLEKDPSHRFADAAALVHALDAREVQPSTALAAPVATSVAGPTTPVGLLDADTSRALSAPTPEELRRWHAPEVVKYRRRFVFYAAVNAVFVLMALFGGTDLLSLTTLWTVLMAYWYAKLWTEGYDWRDVFKQPRDRLLVDVAAETLDDARAIFDKQKRAELRERERLRRRMLAQSDTPTAAHPTVIPPVLVGTPVERRLLDAYAQRDEVVLKWQALAPADRERLPDFAATARQLAEKAAALAVQVATLEQSADPAILPQIEAEIAALEAQANPHEGAVSEERIRRLAYLKRQRRATVDAERRLGQARERLESCLLALQNLRFDLLRLDASAHSYQQVTTLVQRAQRLAEDLDGMIAAEAEVNRRAPLRTADGV